MWNYVKLVEPLWKDPMAWCQHLTESDAGDGNSCSQSIESIECTECTESGRRRRVGDVRQCSKATNQADRPNVVILWYIYIHVCICICICTCTCTCKCIRICICTCTCKCKCKCKSRCKCICICRCMDVVITCYDFWQAVWHVETRLWHRRMCQE